MFQHVSRSSGRIHSTRATHDTRTRYFRWLLLALLLLSFFLRVYRLGDQRVWWDEGFSVWLARFSLLDIARETGNDVHPPLYFWVLHLWRSVFNDSEFALRLPSAFFGTLTVAMTAVLGRAIGGRATGILAALLLTISRFAISYSQEIRMYALASFLAVLALWAARQVWERGRRSDWLLYILSMTAGLYTLYLFFPVFVAANVAWLWQAAEEQRSRGAGERRSGKKSPITNRQSPILQWLLGQAAVLLLFLPWGMYAAGGFLSTSSATPITVRDFLLIYWTVLTVGIPVDVVSYARLTIPAFIAFVVGIFALLRHIRGRPRHAYRTRDFVLLLTVLLLPIIIVYILSLPRQGAYAPPFNPRYLVIFSSFYSILLAWGLASIKRLRDWETKRVEGRSLPVSQSPSLLISTGAAVLLAAVVVYAALVGLRPYYPGRVLVDDYKSLVNTIEAYKQPADVVVLYTDTDWPIFDYHHPEPWRGVPHLWTITPETADAFLAPLWQSHEGLWLVTTPYSAAGDPQRHLPAWLGERAAAAREFSYDDMALHFFARTAERAATADTVAADHSFEPLDLEIEAGVRLAGYQQAVHDFKSGDIIHLFLYTQSESEQEIGLEVGLLDREGQMWGVTAVALPASSTLARQQIDLLVPPELPTGDYMFYAVTTADVAATAENIVRFGRATINQRQTAFLTAEDVSISNRLDAPFAEGITLLGYDVANHTLQPGDSVNLTLYWQAEGALPQSYKVFTHLLGETFNAGSGNFLWGQVDSEPVANTRPTTSWRSGEVIVDQYAIPLQPDAPPGTYRIEIGLYDPLSGARLPVLDENGNPTADHLILTMITAE